MAASFRPGWLLTGAIVAAVGHAHAAILTMGATGTYATLADAVAAAVANDTILIQPGTYDDQVATINVPLTIEGSGGPVIFTQTLPELPHLKGYLITNADTTVENITFQNASVSIGDGDNGAGIRYQAGNLTVINSQFNDNQEGILATPATAGTGTILIENSQFNGNGVSSGPPAGYEHGIYIGMVASLTVIGSTFQGTLVGHDIKSRAAATSVTGNYLDDGVTGTTSYAVDLPDGGVDIVSGNTIDQGPNTQNSTMIAYSDEDGGDTTWAANSLLVSGNLFENTNPAGIAVNNFSDRITATVSCNAFDGVTSDANGLATLIDNVTSGDVPACGLSAMPEPPGPTMWLVGLLALILLRMISPRVISSRLVA